jgi:hypothetical protein
MLLIKKDTGLAYQLFNALLMFTMVPSVTTLLAMVSTGLLFICLQTSNKKSCREAGLE